MERQLTSWHPVYVTYLFLLFWIFNGVIQRDTCLCVYCHVFNSAYLATRHILFTVRLQACPRANVPAGPEVVKDAVQSIYYDLLSATISSCDQTVKIKNCLCPRRKRIWASADISILILNFDTQCRRNARPTLRLLFSRKRECKYLQYRRLAESTAGRFRYQKKKLLPLQGIERYIGRSAP